MSQQCVAAATKIPGCIRRGMMSRDKDVTIPLSTHPAAPGAPCAVLLPMHQERCGQTGESPKKGHEDEKGTENLPYVERLKELGLFSREKTGTEILPVFGFHCVTWFCYAGASRELFMSLNNFTCIS